MVTHAWHDVANISSRWQTSSVRDGNVDTLVVVISRLCNQQPSTYMNLEHMTIVYTFTQLMVSLTLRGSLIFKHRNRLVMVYCYVCNLIYLHKYSAEKKICLMYLVFVINGLLIILAKVIRYRMAFKPVAISFLSVQKPAIRNSWKWKLKMASQNQVHESCFTTSRWR